MSHPNSKHMVNTGIQNCKLYKHLQNTIVQNKFQSTHDVFHKQPLSWTLVFKMFHF